jgi:hypothetical protein
VPPPPRYLSSIYVRVCMQRSPRFGVRVGEPASRTVMSKEGVRQWRWVREVSGAAVVFVAKLGGGRCCGVLWREL